MQKKNYLLYIPIVLFVLLAAYNQFIMTMLDIPDGIYESDQGDQHTFTVFDNGTATIYTFVMDTGKVHYGGKYVMKASAEAYNHLAGDYYFKTQSPFSLRKIPNGDKMGTLTFDFRKCCGYDFFSKQPFEPIKDAYNGRWSVRIGNGCIYLSDDKCTKIQSIPAGYQEYVNTLDRQK